MIIKKSGYITDSIILLGGNESCVYILKGEQEYAMLGGGMVHIMPDVIAQIGKLGIKEKKITQLIILHAHFDHCGMVPFLKKQCPWMRIIASRQAKKLLAMPRVISGIEAMNQGILKKYHRQKEAETMGLGFSGIDVEETVKEGDTFFCGGISMNVIDAPGHSSCSIAVYVPEEKAMFASDAAGIPFGDDVFTAANSDFDNYEKSLEKIASYDIEVLLAEHYGARTGKDARNFIQKSGLSARKTRRMLEASLSRTRNIAKSTQEITEKIMEEAPADFLPKEVIQVVVGQMLKYLSKQMEIGN